MLISLGCPGLVGSAPCPLILSGLAERRGQQLRVGRMHASGLMVGGLRQRLLGMFSRGSHGWESLRRCLVFGWDPHDGSLCARTIVRFGSIWPAVVAGKFGAQGDQSGGPLPKRRLRYVQGKMPCARGTL